MAWDAQTGLTSQPYSEEMIVKGFAILTGVILLSACQSPTEPPPPPVTPSGEEVGEDDSSGRATTEASDPVGPSFCEEFDPSNLSWFDLGGTEESPRSFESGTQVLVSQTRLPDVSASRFNTIAEVCPGFFLVITYDGDTRLLALGDDKWAELPTLTTAGELRGPVAPGVDAGGPVWGFRDSLVVDDAVYLSDGVIDAVQECVHVAVHRLDVEALLTEQSASTDIIYRSEPCVSYTDDYRSRAPIKTHLGGALAYRHTADELYVSIGDLHLGSSRIGQAEAIGVSNVERDYALLTDPNTAVSAVVAISDPGGSPEPRVFAKGLRNSLGMTVSSANELWLSDHGPSGGDELNLIEEDADYGWPLTSEGQPYDRSSYPADSNALPAPWLDIYLAPILGTTAPVYSWTPAVAPTAVVQYPDTGIDGWGGDLIMSTLRAESLVRLTMNNEIPREDRLSLGERVRDMVVTETGQLVVLTDSAQLIVVSP